MTSLSDLTAEQIQKAFQKVSSETSIDCATLILVNQDEQYQKLLEFLRTDFLISEHVSVSAGLEWNPDIESVSLSSLKQNISLALIDDETSDVIGTRIMIVEKSDDKMTEDQFTDINMKKMIRFWLNMDSVTNFYERYHTKEAIHFFGLAVGSKYRKRGFGTKLVEISLNFLKYLNVSPLYIKAEGSSIYSQRIFEKLGFEHLAEVKYDDFKKDGEIVIRSSEVNKSMKSYGKLL